MGEDAGARVKREEEQPRTSLAARKGARKLRALRCATPRHARPASRAPGARQGAVVGAVACGLRARRAPGRLGVRLRLAVRPGSVHL